MYIHIWKLSSRTFFLRKNLCDVKVLRLITFGTRLAWLRQFSTFLFPARPSGHRILANETNHSFSIKAMPNFLGNFFSRLVAGAEQVPSRKDTPQTAGSLRSEYKFGATLGQGAFGLVREATLLRTGEKFAVKTVNKSLLLKKERERLAYKAKQAKLREKGNAGNSASQRKEEPKNESALSIVEREISILKMSGGHPNLIELVDFIETKDDYYLFFPLCSGGELFSRIASAGRFNERDAAVVMATVSNAVAFLHAKGIIHRLVFPTVEASR